MPQTTGALSGVDCPIEVSTNGTTWTNISGSTNSIEPSTQTRMTGVTYTLDGDGAIITAGKKEPVELDVRILFTPSATEAFQIVRAAFEARQDLYVRWSPQGGAVGQLRYQSKGVIAEFLYPRAMAEEAVAIPGGFKLMAPAVVESTIAA